MKWIEVYQGEMGKVFGRVDEDGLMRVTAVEGHPELDEWLAEGNTPEVIND